MNVLDVVVGVMVAPVMVVAEVVSEYASTAEVGDDDVIVGEYGVCDSDGTHECTQVHDIVVSGEAEGCGDSEYVSDGACVYAEYSVVSISEVNDGVSVSAMYAALTAALAASFVDEGE